MKMHYIRCPRRYLCLYVESSCPFILCLSVLLFSAFMFYGLLPEMNHDDDDDDNADWCNV